MNDTTLIVIVTLLLAAGLGLCMFLFVTLKQDLHRAQREAKKATQDLHELLAQQSAGAEGLQKHVSQLESNIEERLAEVPQYSSPKPGMNTSRRMQVLRMYRRGERPEQIAAALGIPQGEVDLLLKVHEISRTA